MMQGEHNSVPHGITCSYSS